MVRGALCRLADHAESNEIRDGEDRALRGIIRGRFTGHLRLLPAVRRRGGWHVRSGIGEAPPWPLLPLPLVHDRHRIRLSMVSTKPDEAQGGATGDLLGPSRHAREQERGGATPPSGLQDSVPQDEALRYPVREIPGLVTVADSSAE